jgi:chromate transporter
MSRRFTEVFSVFLKLGLTSYGGPLAGIALLERTICEEKKWIPRDRFIEIFTICKVLPGPVATMTAISSGREVGGTLGGYAAGTGFILPAFLMMLGLGYIYQSFSHVPGFSAWMIGTQVAAITVVAASVLQMARPHFKKAHAIVLLAVGVLCTYTMPKLEPLLILVAGGLGAYVANQKAKSTRALDVSLLLLLFWVCFKSAAFVFGTGLAVLPVLETEMVGRGWVKLPTFLDGLALGQVTPGPILITATFIGFQMLGVVGAVFATLGIFAPAFFYTLFVVPRVWRVLQGKPYMPGFIAWAVPVVIGTILGSLPRLAMGIPRTVNVLALTLGLIAIQRWIKPPAYLLIPGTGLVCWGLQLGVGAIF